MTFVELRIFYWGGYASDEVRGEHCLTAALGARFDYPRVRALKLIDWTSGIDADGYEPPCWEWERDGGAEAP